MIRKTDCVQVQVIDTWAETNTWLQKGWVLLDENKTTGGTWAFLIGLPKKKGD